MDEENNNSNLNDTIQNDLENRKNIDSLNRIEREAKRKTKDAAKKGARKAAKTLFKPVSWGSLLGFGPILLLIFFIIGVVGFITTMPGLVREEIMSKLLDDVSSLKYAINGSDYYLTEIARDVDNKAQKKVLLYLDEMGIDPVGFGFAPFYTKTEDENGNVTVDYSNNIGSEDIQDVPWYDAGKYRNEMAEKVKQEDLMFKYIVSNERTYLVDSKDSFGNVFGGWISDIISDRFPNMFGDKDLTGMIKTYIAGPDDSSISVDREKKQLLIDSLNFTWNDLSIHTQTARYNLENWTGRFGMPLEFLLALHIGTMSSDITDEMLSNDLLDTEVEVLAEKDEYNVLYEIKYRIDGVFVDLPFPAEPNDPDKAYDELFGLNDHFVQDSDGKMKIDLTTEELESDYKDKITINTLERWIEYMYEWDWSAYVNYDPYINVTNQARDAFLGNDTYRVRYELQGDNINEGDAIWRTSAYMGNILPLDDLHGATVIHDTDTYATYGFEYNPIIMLDDNGTGFRSDVNVSDPLLYNYGSGDTSDNYVVVEVRNQGDDQTSDQYNGNIIVNVLGDEPDIRYGLLNGGSSDVNTYFTGTLHGLEYYIDGHEGEVINSEAVQTGILCMLTQFDSYLYHMSGDAMNQMQFNYVQIEADGQIHYWIDEDGSGEYYSAHIPGIGAALPVTVGDEHLHWMLAIQWIEYLKQNEGRLTTDGINEELRYLQSQINYYFDDALGNRMTHIEEVLDDLLIRLYDIDLNVDDIQTIYQAVCDTPQSFEFVQLRIKQVIKHWYKDVIFEDTDGHLGIRSAYDEVNEPIRLPIQVENEDLQVTAILSGARHGSKTYKQSRQPYVVKGDVVMLDGEIVEGSDLSEKSVTMYNGGTYHLGDGYRVTKKLFTQGQYYTFDGTGETSRSIYFAKELEKLKAGECAMVSVKEGRILTEYKADGLPSSGFSIIASDESWTIYEEAVDNPRVKFYCVQANRDLNYVSVGSTDSDAVQKSKESVEKINGMLKAMGVVTTRKPVSFDNTTADGDIATLTAFGLLEGMHSEPAEYIYKDFKEFLIELGYYTKAEFDYLNTKVLEWFIPDYKPDTNEERLHWNQVKEEDALKYGAMIYPVQTNENGDIIQKGFEPDLSVVAPGNAKIIRKEANIIEFEFDASNQPEIGIVDKYVMQITGINVTTSKGVGDMIESKEEIGRTTETQPIQVIMLNRRGGFVSDVQDYMGPEIANINLENDYIVDTSTGQNIVDDVNTFREMFSDYSVIADNAESFMQIQQDYHVNAVFAAAVAIVESSGGTNGTLVGNGSGSPYNMFSVGYWTGDSPIAKQEFNWTNTSQSHWMQYDSFADSIIDFGAFIQNAPYYFQAGKYRISEIAVPYCPPTAADWAADVSRIMTERLRTIE